MSSGTLKRDSCHSYFIDEHLTVENKNSSTYLRSKTFRYGRESVIAHTYITSRLTIKKEVFDHKKRCKGVKI